jgi:hypothetical protein
MIGIPEIPGGFGYRPGVKYPPNYHELMISNGFMIARPNTIFLKKVHEMQHADLDALSVKLRANPPPDSGRCCPDGGGNYPVRWGQMMGEPMAYVGMDYHSHFKRIMQMPFLNDYL